MAISLLAAFKAIPWTDVITAAPTIVQGAEKLWGTVTKKKNGAPEAPAATTGQHAPETGSAVDARLQALETRIADLQSEALSSSALIKSLAEQNAQLVKAVEILRVRTRILLRWGGLALAVALLCAIAALLR